MALIRVWAPRPAQVELVCGERVVPMTRDHGGWWSVDAPFVTHGVDYAFLLDGEGPLPDPRSAWQPEGVHGPSRWLDHARFRWRDAGWRAAPLASAVIYELHVGSFSREGTFDAAIGRLDHLVDLGVTHVELLPVAEFPGARGWGYDGVDLYAPHHAYGGPEGLKRLVDACHQRGLAVLLDVVYNHVGPDGNYLGRFGPYFTERYVTPWGQAVNVDGRDSDEVRRFFLDNALMWLRDYHLDGLRIDAVHAIVDMSAVHLLEQLAVEVRALEGELGRPLVLIAESDLNDPRMVRPHAVGGYGLDAHWNEDFHHALHALLTGERDGYYQDYGRLADLATVLTQGYAYDGAYSTHRRRRHGRPATGLSGRQLVACLQNHDQIGNRARGERTSQLLAPELLRVGAALVLTAPFVPMLFQGEEWGASTPFLYFTDHADPELAEAVRRGRTEEFAAFGWSPDDVQDPQAEATYRRSQLDWDEPQRAPHAAMLDWHRALLALRRRLPGLSDDRLERVSVAFDEAARWLVMTRGAVRVACNLGGARQRIPVAVAGASELVLCSDADVVVEAEAVSLDGHAVAVLAGEGELG